MIAAAHAEGPAQVNDTAVRKAVSRATTSKVAIAADGSVSVRMVLPGSVFWEALTSP